MLNQEALCRICLAPGFAVPPSINAPAFIYGVSELDGVIIYSLIPVFERRRFQYAHYHLLVAVQYRLSHIQRWPAIAARAEP
jgi:hypothetical protein